MFKSKNAHKQAEGEEQLNQEEYEKRLVVYIKLGLMCIDVYPKVWTIEKVEQLGR